MRRNLRLDWRALALLGALLSIIIEWPGLVFAMPTVKATAAIKNDTTTNITDIVMANLTILRTATTSSSNSIYEQPVKLREAATATTTESTTTIVDLINTDNYRNISVSVSTLLSDSLYLQQQQQENLNNIIQQQQDNNLSDTFNNNINTTKTKPQRTFATTTTNNINNTIINYNNTSSARANATAINDVNNNNMTYTSNNNNTNIQHQATMTTPPPTTTTSDKQFNAQANSTSSAFDLSHTVHLTSSHHIAILSRTERSIRASLYANATTRNANVSINSINNNKNIVRRSSDASQNVGGFNKTKRLNNSRNLNNHNHSHSHSHKFDKNNLDRIERAVQDLTGISRKIQIYIKNRFLEIQPDGTVGGTQDAYSDYTILYRVTINIGLIKIQSVATCLYLCMDECGSAYASKEFNDDCVFNETMGEHTYNIYTSTYNSNERRILYLALNGQGKPRKLHINRNRTLGKLAKYANALTETVELERVERLIARNFGANRVQHGIRQLCDTGKRMIEIIDSKNFKAPPKCNPNSSNSANSSNKKLSNSNRNSSSSSSSVSSSSSGSGSSSSGSGSNAGGQSSANSDSQVSVNSSSSSSSGSGAHEQLTHSVANSSSSSSSSSSNSSSSSGSLVSNLESANQMNNKQNNNNNSSGHNSNKRPKLSQNRNHSGGEKIGKKRKCQPHENEQEHQCRMQKPAALRKQNQKLKRQQLKLQQQQQQQQQNSTAASTQKNNKNGAQKLGGNKRPNQARLGNNGKKNALAGNDNGANNRRGKKLNGRPAAKQQPNGNGKNNGPKKKLPQGANKRGNANQRQRKFGTTTTTTTLAPTTTSAHAHMLDVLVGSTTVPSSLPAASLLHLETTSDRGEREQRNVRFTDSMETSQELLDDDEDAEEEGGGVAENENVAAETPDSDEDTSSIYDADDDFDDGAERGHKKTVQAIATAAAVPQPYPPIAAGADDISYYDQYDFHLLPSLGFWEIIALLWTANWCLS